MAERALVERVTAIRPELLDGLAGLVLSLVALGELAGNLGGGWRSVATVAVVVVFGASLTLRRRYPLMIACVLPLAANAGDLLDGTASQANALFVAYLLVSYSVGAHRELRPALTGVIVIVAGLFLDELLSAHHGSISPIVPFVIGAPLWVLGRQLRTRRRLSAELADRALALETERHALAELAVRHERARIARELHDVIAHCLSLIVIQAGAGRRVVERDTAAAARAFRGIADAGGQALVELELLIGLLASDDGATPAAASGIGGVPALVAGARRAGLKVDLEMLESATPRAPEVSATAFRLVQEGLTNVLKHAGPVAVRVTLRELDGTLDLTIENDRPAAPRAASVAGAGHGIVGMRERVELLGGELDTQALAGGGFRLAARLPLNATLATPQPRAPAADANELAVILTNDTKIITPADDRTLTRP